MFAAREAEREAYSVDQAAPWVAHLDNTQVTAAEQTPSGSGLEGTTAQIRKDGHSGSKDTSRVKITSATTPSSPGQKPAAAPAGSPVETTSCADTEEQALAVPPSHFIPATPSRERGAPLAAGGEGKQGEDIQQHHGYLTLQRHWPRCCGSSRASARGCAQTSLETLPCAAQSQVSPRETHNLAGCSLGRSRNFKATTLGTQGSGLSPEEGAEPGSPGWGVLA